VFGLLARRGHSATLEGLWRFQHRWEAHATRQLRNGDPGCLDTYAKHGRINGGDHDAMLDVAHTAWAADRAAGRTSLLVAADNATVTELNQRVRTVLVAAGEVAAEGVELRDGTTAGIGDIIVTRENARRIRTTDGRWVRNGDTWQVVDVHPDGALTVQETNAHRNRGKRGHVFLDVHYVAEQVQLGYAITAHRAQGATVDSCHVMVSPGMTREAFYVAMTRGRYGNTTYVVTEHADPEQEDHRHAIGEPPSTQQVLRKVLATEGTERSATEQLQQRVIETELVRTAPKGQQTPTPRRHPDQVHVVGAVIQR
jgi:ATP-dependent exoDNAse (exonuclease V) alpha subunit